MDKEELLTRLITRSNDLIETATKVGVAYVGYKANNHWSGGLAALVALKLAAGGNLAAGVAGIGTLTFLGLMNIRPVKPPDVWTTPVAWWWTGQH